MGGIDVLVNDSWGGEPLTQWVPTAAVAARCAVIRGVPDGLAARYEQIRSSS
jgi:hypothetical protein